MSPGEGLPGVRQRPGLEDLPRRPVFDRTPRRRTRTDLAPIHPDPDTAIQPSPLPQSQDPQPDIPRVPLFRRPPLPERPDPNIGGEPLDLLTTPEGLDAAASSPAIEGDPEVALRQRSFQSGATGGGPVRPVFETVNEAYGGKINPEQFTLNTPNLGIDPLTASVGGWEDSIVDALRKVPTFNKQTGKHNVNLLRYEELENAVNGIWGITDTANIPASVKGGRDAMMRRIMESLWLLGTQAGDDELRSVGFYGSGLEVAEDQRDIAPLGLRGSLRKGLGMQFNYGDLPSSERQDPGGLKVAQDLMNKWLGTNIDLSKSVDMRRESASTLEGRIRYALGAQLIRKPSAHKGSPAGLAGTAVKYGAREDSRRKGRLTGEIETEPYTTSSGRSIIPSQGLVDDFMKENLGPPGNPSVIASDPKARRSFFAAVERVLESGDVPSTTLDKVKSAITDWRGQHMSTEAARDSRARKEAPKPAAPSQATDNQGTGPTGGPAPEPEVGGKTVDEVVGMADTGNISERVRTGQVGTGVRPLPAGAKPITNKATIESLRGKGSEKTTPRAPQPAAPKEAATTGPGDPADADIETLGGEPVDLLGGDVARQNVRTAMEEERVAEGNSPEASRGTFGKGKKANLAVDIFDTIVKGVLGLEDDPRTAEGGVGEMAGAIETGDFSGLRAKPGIGTQAAGAIAGEVGDLLTNPGQAAASVAKSFAGLKEGLKGGFTRAQELVQEKKDWDAAKAAGKKPGPFSTYAESQISKEIKTAEQELREAFKTAGDDYNKLVEAWDQTEEAKADAQRLADFNREVAALTENFKRDDQQLANIAQVVEAFGNFGRRTSQRTASHFLLGMNNMPKDYKAKWIQEYRQKNKEEKDNELYRLSAYALTGHEFPKGTSVDQIRTLLPTLHQEKQGRAARALAELKIKQAGIVFNQQQQASILASLRREGMDESRARQLAATAARETLRINMDLMKLELEGKRLKLDAWSRWTDASLKKQGLDQTERAALQKAIIAAKGTQVSELHVRKIGGIKTLIQTVDEVIKMREQDPANTNTGPVDELWSKTKWVFGRGNPKYRMFRSKVMAILNTYVNAITGKQMSQVEVTRIKSVVPKVTDGEHVFLPLARTFRAYMMLDMRNYVRTLAAAGYNVKGLAGEIPAKWQERGADGKWGSIRSGVISDYGRMITRTRASKEHPEGQELQTAAEVQARKKDFRLMDDTGKHWTQAANYRPFERKGKTVFKGREEILEMHRQGKLDKHINEIYGGMGVEESRVNLRGLQTGIPTAGQ